ncbi:hypothetical protein F5B22DRAFT_632999 [Xylaria bambusicola]|uniref:uncharacterized protein n=1 Tax=Xylaria bambusicola TaxID=326684 RepID=UPI002008D6B4|nr:uncharacterized protein F5B22DRAFT_632999 [Xylaria bambusicola]KAI0526531.1 hypothetical protein F5B22DRAFT_632999 [Xylaria bambusicola]
MDSDEWQANITCVPQKRPFEQDPVESKRRNHGSEHLDDYTVGWICALPIEMAAAKCMLQVIHGNLEKSPSDSNAYILGSLHSHNVVIACLPMAGYGTNNAAIVASNMRRTFPFIRMFLLVGIGGGVPDIEHDVRLGDVVISTGVIQYDIGKTIQQGLFQATGVIRRPMPTLMTVVSALRARHESEPSQIPDILSDMRRRYPTMREYTDLERLQDLLFDSAYDHAESSENCNDCDRLRLKHRPMRNDQHPQIHYGIIASGNQVMKHARTRDRLAQEYKAICFEMEPAGLMESFQCLVIRGVCDYSDSHKSKEWQKYASATAAAYTNELLSVIPTTGIESSSSREVIQDRRRLLMDSLSFSKIDARHSNIKPAHGKTCAWLLSHPDYIGWLAPTEYPQHHGLLWIHGKPGAGKSTLMKYIYTRAQENAGITLSFFFNARGDALEKSTEGMYRSLLLQLLEKLPDLQEVLDQAGYHCSSYNSNVPWRIDSLQSLFSAAIAKIGRQRVTCFIDALDECSESQVRDMVEYLEQLGQYALESGKQLYICFSSRHYPTICIQHGRSLTLEDQNGHSLDLEKYVRNKLKAGKGKDVEPIRAELLQKSAGVFMWVVLVVDILNEEFERGRIFAVRKRLRETPAELSALFKNILRRDNKNMADLLLCIQWILYAKCPLKPEEFYFAVVAGLDPEPQNLSEWDPQYITTDDIKRFVSSSSKGLAEVTKPRAGTVQFIHESVRDFLLKDGGIRDLWPDLERDFQSRSHNQLKECCYTFMKTDISVHVSFDRMKTYVSKYDQRLPKASSDEAKALRQRLSEKFPFLQYATHNVLYHANAAAIDLPQEKFLKTFDLESWIYLNNVIENFEIRRHTPSASLPYILAENNFASLINRERYASPLFAAIVNGHQEAIVALLQLGETALVENGLREFKSSRYGQNFKLSKGQTPLHWAMKGGCTDIESEYNDSRPLSLAAEHKHTEILKLLLDRGANTEPGTLSFAISCGHTNAIQLLLDRGADIESKDRFGFTPLFWAVIQRRLEIVKLLLHRGANFRAMDNAGDTPMSLAMRYKHEEMVRVLSAFENGQEN